MKWILSNKNEYRLVPYLAPHFSLWKIAARHVKRVHMHNLIISEYAEKTRGEFFQGISSE